MKFEICDVDWDSHENMMVFLEKKSKKKPPTQKCAELRKIKSYIAVFLTTFNIFQNLLKSVSHGD